MIKLESITASASGNNDYQPNIDVGKSISETIIKQFADETDNHKRAIIKDWTIRCYNWMEKTRQFTEKQERMRDWLEKHTITAKKNLQEFTNMMKNLQEAEELILDRTLLKEGYILINEIGEKIRGEELLYSVTITSTGGSITSGTDVYTVKVKIEDFLQYFVPKMTSKRGNLVEMNLRKSSVLAKMVKTQIKNGGLQGQIEKWSDEKIASYGMYADQILNAKNQNFNVNQGQILEAFFRFTQNYSVGWHQESSYWAPLIDSMKNTLKAPDPFWKGGDIGREQIKGLNASITNLGSLINIVSETLKILVSTRVGANTLAPFIQKELLSQYINDKGNKTIKAITDDLIDLFTSGISR